MESVRVGMDTSHGLRLLQGFFHHFFDTLPDRFLHRFLDRLFHFLRIQTRAPGLRRHLFDVLPSRWDSAATVP